MNDNYVNLHVHTDASIGDSVIKIPDLVKQVEEYGQDYVEKVRSGELDPNPPEPDPSLVRVVEVEVV